jgi:hypothetical protein
LLDKKSLRVVFNIAHIRDVAGEFVNGYFVDKVSAHRVEEVGLFVDDVLVIEEELVRLE